MPGVSPSRALAAAVAAVTLALPAALVAQAGEAPSATATGYAALLPGGTQGAATADTGGVAERRGALSGLRPAGGGTIASAGVRMRAWSDGPDAVAEGTVEAGGLTLLDGRVRIGGLRMSARAATGAQAGTTGVTEAAASGVVVDGAPVSVAPGAPVPVPGIGALVFFEGSGAGGSVQANALRVQVSDPRAAAVIGEPFVIGHLDLTARAGTAPPGPATAEPEEEAPATTSPAPSTTPDPPPAPGTAPDPRGSPPFAPTPSLGVPRRAAPGRVAVTGDGYVFPVLGDASFVDDYGAPRAGTGWHHGNDVFAATGTPLVAVADGRLSRVGWNTLGGNRLWLTDDAGNAFYYAHLSAYAPAAVEGARVRAGQVIGFVGNTGQAITTPPHLHFEIHPAAGDSVNPYPYLVAWQRGGDIPRAFAQAAASPSPAPAAGAVLVDGVPEVDAAPAPDDGLATPAR